MYRVLILAFTGFLAAYPAHAEEMCLACDEPAASYRCTVEQPSEKYKLGRTLEQEICSKVLAKTGQHSKCRMTPVPEGGACTGLARTVTVTDYQRAMSPSGEPTYEVGAFEIARRNVHDTWQCVLSMFKDC